MEDAGRLLGLADQFLEDREQHEGHDDPECKERRQEWDAIRPMLAAAPDMLADLKAGIDAAQEVIDNWCKGDLAAAVNALEEWAATVRHRRRGR